MAQKECTFTTYIDIFGNSGHGSFIGGYENKQEGFEVLSDTEIEAVTTEYMSLSNGPNENKDVDRQEDSSDVNALCGYLRKYKQGSRSSLYKKRWFVFSRDHCKLFYYRTPHDIVPLGEMEISRASFSIMVDEDFLGDDQKVFEIRTPSKQYLLEAPDEHTRQYWLQELQKCRREYSIRKTKLSKKERTVVHESKGGLVCQDLAVTLSDEHSPSPQLVEPVNPPVGVGQGAAYLEPSGGIKDLSFAHFKTEMRNVFTNLKTTRQSSESRLSGTITPPQVTSPATTPSSEHPPSQSTNVPARSKVQQFKDMTKKLGRPKNLNVAKSQGGEVECQRCIHLKEHTEQLKREFGLLEEELQATREIMRVLQKQIDVQQHHQITQIELAQGQDPVTMIHGKDEEIVNLKHCLALSEEDNRILKSDNRTIQLEVKNLLEKIAAFEETLKAKDEVVMVLSNKLQEFHAEQVKLKEFGDAGLKSNQLISIPCEVNQDVNLQKRCQQNQMYAIDYNHLDKLKDENEAYRSQNKFLNKEILELNKLRMDDETRERQLLNRCGELEAKFIQMQSKYLISLKELSSPQQGRTEYSEETVKQLIADAMAMDVSLQTYGNHFQDADKMPVRLLARYDDDGFTLFNPDEYYGKNHESQISGIDSWSKEKEVQEKNYTSQLSSQVKWESYMNSLGPRELSRCVDVKALVRMGIPRQYRQRVWKLCIEFRIGKLRRDHGPNYYQQLLQRYGEIETCLNPVFKQIEMDLLRTLPNNKFYESMNSGGICKLRNVLNAYAVHSPGMGYCQGVNRLAAIALLYLDEEEAFWCLGAIIDSILPSDYYTSTLLGAQVDQKVLQDLLMEKLPEITSHLKVHSVDLAMFTFNWFLTIFVDALPPSVYLRIWDTFLYEGSKVLFRFALAILKYCESDLLTLSSPLDLHRYIQSLSQHVTDSNKLCEIAFKEFNPLSMKTICDKRSAHLVGVKVELQHLASMRSTRRKGSERQSIMPDFTSDDEL